MQRVDVAVVGGGPAGLSAAGWLGRYRRSTVVFDTGEYRNRWVEQVHAFLSRDPTTPVALLDQARTDLNKYDSVQVSGARVLAARKNNGLFQLTTDDGRLEARRVILATGVEDVFPDLPGFFEHYGADVFHCPTCDGYESRGRDVAAIGWGAHVTGFALGLLDWARSVTVFTNGKRFEGGDADRDLLGKYGIRLVEQPVTELLGQRGQLCGLRLGDGSECACQIAFFSIAHKPRTALAEQLGCELTEHGYVHVDYNGATTVPGVFAAGDLTPGQQLVSVAAANGAAAAVVAAESLRGEAVADRPGNAPDVDAALGAARDE
jgi:thioredoxin reductase